MVISSPTDQALNGYVVHVLSGFALCGNIDKLVLQQGRPVGVAEVGESQFAHVTSEKGSDDVQQDGLAVMSRAEQEKRLFVPTIGGKKISEHFPH